MEVWMRSVLIFCLIACALGAKKAASPPGISNIIPSAGQAELMNGVGDILLNGSCKRDLRRYCKNAGTAGDGRLASCITSRIRAVKLGNEKGQDVNPKCVDEVKAFKVDRSSHINKDVPLAKACGEAVKKLCKDKNDNTKPGSVTACLREKHGDLSGACKSEVYRYMAEINEYYKADYTLATACESDISSVCPDVDPDRMGLLGRAALDCLADRHIQVGWECQNAMGIHDQDFGDDIRLSSRLFQKCYGDYQKFCKDVEPGNMQVQECLEDNMEEDEFDEGCKEELESTLSNRTKGLKMDSKLRKACTYDLENMCGINVGDFDKDKNVKRTALKCLEQYKYQLRSQECKDEIHRKIARESRDIRLNEMLALACTEDRKKYCSDVNAGSARVIRCLEDHRRSLDKNCAAALFDHEVKAAEDIDFNYPMKRACAWEIKNFCPDVEHGHALIVRCLEGKMEDTDMSKECKQEVEKDGNRRANDVRLNYRLFSSCEKDIKELCANPCLDQPGQSCGGLVLRCLTEKSKKISSEQCQEEVFYYELMEVSDFRNDVILAEACRDDVEQYCADTEPGEGRVHACLRSKKDVISAECASEEQKLQEMEYKDIRLLPRLNKLCSEEKNLYCKKVPAGNGRVMKCLLENMAEADFGEECAEELKSREDAMRSDYRYDVGVMNNCEADIDQYCAAEKSVLRGKASVLKCLVSNFRDLAEPCQAEMSSVVRMALWDYKPGAALTVSCDSDVERFCRVTAGNSRPKDIFTIGAIGRCLSKAMVVGTWLDKECRTLVISAAPKDSRAFLDSAESSHAIVQKIADLQKAAGLDGALVDPYARGGSQVTVTGWIALLCIISLFVVAIGGGTLLYRRAVGTDKPHTLHVKMGDS